MLSVLHAAAIARCRRHVHLDRAGAGRAQRHPAGRPDGRVANSHLRRRDARSSDSALTNSAGIATKTLTVGPLAEGQTASINACLNGTNQCVAFSAFGARPEYALLEAISGTSQILSASGTPTQIALRLLDMDGNPMAGGTVALYQALYAWTPPCSPHMVCPPGALLATQAATAISAIDGSVMFVPAAPARRGHQSPRPRRLGKHLDGECLDRAESLRPGTREQGNELAGNEGTVAGAAAGRRLGFAPAAPRPTIGT